MSATVLLKLQTGPVLDFLVPARTARELWAGSWLLSRLARTGAEVLRDTPGAEIIGPSLECTDDPLEASTPPFVLARLPAGQAGLAARAAEDAIRAEWRRIAAAVHRFLSAGAPAGWDGAWAKQVESRPRVEWILHPCPDDALALRTLAKGESPLLENAPDFRKPGSCLDCLHLAMAEWKFAAKRSSRGFSSSEVQDEPLFLPGQPPSHALALIARFFPDAYLRDELGWPAFAPAFDSMPHLAKQTAGALRGEDGSAVPSPVYHAVLLLDGDDLIPWFAGCGGGPGNLHPLRPGYQSALSHRLAGFAARAPGVVDQFVGQTLYSGGDALLALLPASSALPCADELARAFSRTLPGATSSAAVVFCPVGAPLGDAVRSARAALALAKQTPGKDTLYLRILQPDGGHADLACRWRGGAIRVWRELESRKGSLGQRFASLLTSRLRSLLAAPGTGHGQGWEPEWTGSLQEAARLELAHLIQSQAPLTRQEAASLAESWHGTLARFSPRDYLKFWLAWSFLRRMDDLAEPAHAEIP